jgi:hypothetical protein
MTTARFSHPGDFIGGITVPHERQKPDLGVEVSNARILSGRCQPSAKSAESR